MTNKLTGRRRHRTQRFWGKTLLVLQVEEQVRANYDEYDSYPGTTILVWRDAIPEDLTVEG